MTTVKDHIRHHGSGMFMILASHEVSQEEYEDRGIMADRQVFLGFARDESFHTLRYHAALFPETAHLAVAPRPVEQYALPPHAPFLRLGSEWAAGWVVKSRGSTWNLEPETECGLCGWKPYRDAEEEDAGS